VNIATYQEEDQHWEDGRARLRPGPVLGYWGDLWTCFKPPGRLRTPRRNGLKAGSLIRRDLRGFKWGESNRRRRIDGMALLRPHRNTTWEDSMRPRPRLRCLDRLSDNARAICDREFRLIRGKRVRAVVRDLVRLRLQQWEGGRAGYRPSIRMKVGRTARSLVQSHRLPKEKGTST
jgi:hypothetical protein